MTRRPVYFVLIGICLIISSCDQSASTVDIPSPVKQQMQISSKILSQEEIEDKVLGAIVGSAIGDAMGASTEMWTREDIQERYGYIDGLTPAYREQSPEGTWEHDLVAGATTDDTRWKYFMGQYFVRYKGTLSPHNFTSFINDYYDQVVQELSDDRHKSSTDQLDAQVEKVDWIKEWARVTKAYALGDDEYQVAQGRFYGGEMSCAGLLYSPMFGLLGGDPVASYNMAYEHALFDIGYAKDITAMASTMTYLAMHGQDFESIVDSSLLVDPHGYRDSRLIGRLLQASATEITQLVEGSEKLELLDSIVTKMPQGYPGTELDWLRQDYIYQGLEKRQKAIAFHAGEIWDITYASLLFGRGDFRKTMSFIVNYGRDNDTVAAIVGTMLGAYLGYDALPDDLKLEIIKVNREVIGIDLEELAQDLYPVAANL